MKCMSGMDYVLAGTHSLSFNQCLNSSCSAGQLQSKWMQLKWNEGNRITHSFHSIRFHSIAFMKPNEIYSFVVVPAGHSACKFILFANAHSINSLRSQQLLKLFSEWIGGKWNKINWVICWLEPFPLNPLLLNLNYACGNKWTTRGMSERANGCNHITNYFIPLHFAATHSENKIKILFSSFAPGCLQCRISFRFIRFTHSTQWICFPAAAKFPHLFHCTPSFRSVP